MPEIVTKPVAFCGGSVTVKLALALRVAAPKVPETGTLKVPAELWLTVSCVCPGQFSGLLVNTPPENDVLNCTAPLKPVLVEHVTV